MAPTDKDLVRAYRNVKPGVPVTVNDPHVAALRRVLALLDTDTEEQ
jgi:hypothetical protein